MSRAILLTLCLVSIAADAPPASQPAGVDAGTWKRMLEIDAKAGQIDDLVADFEQQKFTAMLRKPLISSGRVFVRGSSMLWDTRKPEPNVLQINAREARIYYPRQNTIEVYQIQQKLGQLAASPLPRLETLRQHFSFEPLALSEIGGTDEANQLAVKLIPSEAELREHIEQVRVLLDARSGLIVRLEMRDPDGDRTVINFTSAKPNSGLRDDQLEIAAPADVKITRPLEAIEGHSQDDHK